MPESQTSQTVIGYSTAPETAYGTNPVTAAVFTPMVTRVRELPVTDQETSDDRGVVGRNDSEFPSFQRTGFRIPTAFEISDVVNVTTLAALARRFLGKVAAVPTVTEALIAFKHIFYMADPNADGLQLPSSSVVYQNNEYDYLHRGVVGSTLQLTQTGVADPQYTLATVGAGVAKRISVDYGSFGVMAVPGQDAYMYGPSSAIQYTDDSSATVSLVTPTHKARSVTVNINNNLDTGDTRMGMPQVDTAEPKRGWYRDFLYMGEREVSGEFTMGMDSSYTLKDAQELNTVYTNFTWQMNGDNIPTSVTPNKYYWKVIIPKFNLRTPRTGEEGTRRTKGFTIFPLRHSAHYGPIRFEIQNGVATAIA